jgi:DHA2 family multidrug resistance protein
MKRANLKSGFRIDYIGIGLISLGLGSMQIILDKGQRDDWLASNFIRVFFALMVFGLIAGIIWELREKEPVVDLRMLKERNFAISTLAMFFLGFVMYSSTVLIPQLLQQLLGYTAELAGLALSPGGAVIMCMMPVVGILVSKVDTRILIAFGCVVSASALFVMAGWDLGLDFGHAVRARMLQTFGLAFLFIPINVAAFAYVPKEKTNMGTGIINLARNVGASVGIATVTTMLARRAQFHQARLADHVNNLNPAVRSMTNGTTLRLISHGSSAAVAAAQSHGMIYNMVQRQAAMLAYLDNFKFLGIAFLAVIPALLLMRKPRVPAGGAPAH